MAKFLAILLLAILLPIVNAEKFVVDTDDDVVDGTDGKTSLREAVAASNLINENNEIEFAAGVKKIKLKEGEIGIDNAGNNLLTIEGPVEINSKKARVFFIGGNSRVEIRRVTFAKASGDEGGAVFVQNGSTIELLLDCVFEKNKSGGDGGALFVDNNATVTEISDCVFAKNKASGDGGAIYNEGEIEDINDCLFEKNKGRKGGAIHNEDSVVVVDSTFAKNKASDDGGAINNDGDCSITACTFEKNKGDDGGGTNNEPNSTMQVLNSTYSKNKGKFGGGHADTRSNDTVFSFCTFTANKARDGAGIALAANSNNVEINNCLIAENKKDDLFANGNDFIDGGFNLIGNPEGHNIAGGINGNITNVDPELDRLANNGGPTQTHALKNNSPAIDAADPASNVNQDQRGRNRGGVNDIGAFERGSRDRIVDPQLRMTMSGTVATLTWQDPPGVDVVGFHIWRRIGSSRKYHKISPLLVLSTRGSSEQQYSFSDSLVNNDEDVIYRLECVTSSQEHYFCDVSLEDE